MENNDFGIIIGIIVISIVCVVGILVSVEVKQTKIFMEECLKEHKQYECTYMWRSR
jgi:hypothetical protein